MVFSLRFRLISICIEDCVCVCVGPHCVWPKRMLRGRGGRGGGGEAALAIAFGRSGTGDTRVYR